MPSILYPNDNVSYIARKNFTWKGTKYVTGDDCPEFNDHYKLETFVRAGFIIPVVEDKEDLPFQFRRTVMTREMARAKLRLGNPKGDHENQKRGLKKDAKLTGEDPNAPELTEPEPDLRSYPHDYTVDEVIDYAAEHVEELPNLIDAEERGKERSTLLKRLYELFEESEESQAEIRGFEENEESQAEIEI